MDEKSILVVGDWRHVHFAAPLGWLDVHAACTYYCNVQAAAADLRSPSRRADPAGILLLQSRPGQFSRRDIEGFHAAAPLARLVALVGPWCEGGQRNARVWPGAEPAPWRSWTYRLAREFGLADSTGSYEPLPYTATEVERIEREAALFLDRTHIAAKAAVYTDRRPNYECLAELLSRLGVKAIWHPETAAPASDVDFGIYDNWPRAEAAFSPEIPAILLLHFPRPQDQQRAQAAGIAAVIAQPLLANALAVAMEAVVRGKTPRAEYRVTSAVAGLPSR